MAAADSVYPLAEIQTDSVAQHHYSKRLVDALTVEGSERLSLTAYSLGVRASVYGEPFATEDAFVTFLSIKGLPAPRDLTMMQRDDLVNCALFSAATSAEQIELLKADVFEEHHRLTLSRIDVTYFYVISAPWADDLDAFRDRLWLELRSAACYSEKLDRPKDLHIERHSDCYFLRYHALLPLDIDARLSTADRPVTFKLYSPRSPFELPKAVMRFGANRLPASEDRTSRCWFCKTNGPPVVRVNCGHAILCIGCTNRFSADYQLAADDTMRCPACNYKCITFSRQQDARPDGAPVFIPDELRHDPAAAFAWKPWMSALFGVTAPAPPDDPMTHDERATAARYRDKIRIKLEDFAKLLAFNESKALKKFKAWAPKVQAGTTRLQRLYAALAGPSGSVVEKLLHELFCWARRKDLLLEPVLLSPSTPPLDTVVEEDTVGLGPSIDPDEPDNASKLPHRTKHKTKKAADSKRSKKHKKHHRDKPEPATETTDLGFSDPSDREYPTPNTNEALTLAPPPAASRAEAHLSLSPADNAELLGLPTKLVKELTDDDRRKRMGLSVRLKKGRYANISPIDYYRRMAGSPRQQPISVTHWYEMAVSPPRFMDPDRVPHNPRIMPPVPLRYVAGAVVGMMSTEEIKSWQNRNKTTDDPDESKRRKSLKKRCTGQGFLIVWEGPYPGVYCGDWNTRLKAIVSGTKHTAFDAAPSFAHAHFLYSYFFARVKAHSPDPFPDKPVTLYHACSMEKGVPHDDADSQADTQPDPPTLKRARPSPPKRARAPPPIQPDKNEERQHTPTNAPSKLPTTKPSANTPAPITQPPPPLHLDMTVAVDTPAISALRRNLLGGQTYPKPRGDSAAQAQAWTVCNPTRLGSRGIYKEWDSAVYHCGSLDFLTVVQPAASLAVARARMSSKCPGLSYYICGFDAPLLDKEAALTAFDPDAEFEPPRIQEVSVPPPMRIPFPPPPIALTPTSNRFSPLVDFSPDADGRVSLPVDDEISVKVSRRRQGSRQH
jgi:hypothetical protein